MRRSETLSPVKCWPDNRIEDLLGVGKPFDDQRHAKLFFSDPNNINPAMEGVVTMLLPPP